jgi:hypothetical protein
MSEITLSSEFFQKLASVICRVPDTIDALVAEVQSGSTKEASADLKKEAAAITQQLVESGDLSSTLAGKMTEKLSTDPGGAIQTIRYLITKRAEAEQALSAKEKELHDHQELNFGGPGIKTSSNTDISQSRQQWCNSLLG